MEFGFYFSSTHHFHFRLLFINIQTTVNLLKYNLLKMESIMNLFLYSLKCLSMRLTSLVIPVLQAHPRYLIALALMSTSYVLHPACTVSRRFGIRVISHSQLLFFCFTECTQHVPVCRPCLLNALPPFFRSFSPLPPLFLPVCLTAPVDQHPLCCELLLI